MTLSISSTPYPDSGKKIPESGGHRVCLGDHHDPGPLPHVLVAQPAEEPDPIASWEAQLEEEHVWLERGKATKPALGISDRMVKYYEDGRHMIPKTVMLACRGYDALRSSAAA